MAQDTIKKQGSKPDPKSLNYCGYKCTSEGELYKGTLENNTELKKKAYVDFKFREKYGVEFDPEKIFCFGCKINDKPLRLTLRHALSANVEFLKGMNAVFNVMV